MSNEKRVNDGRPIPGETVVAADAITLLSGITFGSVVKVLAAIEAVRMTTGADIADIVNLANVPIERVVFDGTKDARIRATDEFVNRVVRTPTATSRTATTRTG